MTITHSMYTPVLHVVYEQTGPEDGDPVLLLHGFPYDVRQFDKVREPLAAAGKRVIVPFLRGYGPTVYRVPETLRSGQQAAIGHDIVELMDALSLKTATLAGFDWGARGACVAAALWPERVTGLVSCGGYTIQDIAKEAATPASPLQELQFWYQWYFNTERGRAGLEQNGDELCRLLWSTWSPGWSFTDAEFARTARSFHTSDFVPTVIHSYRHRYGNAPGDPALEALEARLAEAPEIPVPSISLHGADDPVETASCAESKEGKFTGKHERRVLAGIGHCPPAEAPDAFVQAIVELTS